VVRSLRRLRQKEDKRCASSADADLAKFVVVDEVGPVTVDESAEGKSVLPTVGRNSNDEVM